MKVIPRTTAALARIGGLQERGEAGGVRLQAGAALHRAAQREKRVLDLVDQAGVARAQPGLVRLEAVEVGGDEQAAGAVAIAASRQRDRLLHVTARLGESLRPRGAVRFGERSVAQGGERLVLLLRGEPGGGQARAQLVVAE